MRDSIIMTKYQGFGNDYLVLDAKKNQLQLQGKSCASLPAGVRTWSGWCALRTSWTLTGKMGMHIFNSDGSEAAISGNGVCIFAKYLMDNEYVTEKNLPLRLYPEQSK